MQPSPPPLPPGYRDRRTGLIVFGVLDILLGAFLALSVPLAFVGQMINARQTGLPVSWAQILTSTVQVAAFAVVLIWLGIGSIKARRWARAILLCGGWIGLVVGVVMCALLPFMLPSMRAAMEQRSGGQEMPPAILQVVLVVTVAVMAVFYVVIPGIMVLFYRSPHVKRTCEARDPVERWTDRCPLPVLGAVLALGYSAFAVLLVLPQFGRAFFFFGVIVTGVPALLLWIAVAGFMAWATVGFYRFDRRAWWGCVVFMVVFGTSAAVSFARVDLLEYYRMAGLPEAQIELVRGSPLMQGGRIVWLMLPS